jgi:hypothetical protein
LLRTGEFGHRKLYFGYGIDASANLEKDEKDEKEDRHFD